MIGKIISKTADGKIKWTLVGANAYASGLKGSVYELKKKTLLISDEKVKATAEEIADLRKTVMLSAVKRFSTEA